MPIGDLSNVTKFKWLCYKVIPLVYDQSLSYYEFLAKVLDKLNELIDSNNAQNELLIEFGQEIDEWEKRTDEKYNAFVAKITEDIDNWETETENKFNEMYNNFTEQINASFEKFKQDSTDLYTTFTNNVNSELGDMRTDIADFKSDTTADIEKFKTDTNTDISEWKTATQQNYDAFVSQSQQQYNNFITQADNKYTQFTTDITNLVKQYADQIEEDQTALEAKVDKQLDDHTAEINQILTQFKSQIEQTMQGYGDSYQQQFDDFFDHYLETLGIIDNFGFSKTDTMSQDAITQWAMKLTEDIPPNFVITKQATPGTSTISGLTFPVETAGYLRKITFNDYSDGTFVILNSSGKEVFSRPLENNTISLLYYLPVGYYYGLRFNTPTITYHRVESQIGSYIFNPSSNSWSFDSSYIREINFTAEFDYKPLTDLTIDVVNTFGDDNSKAISQAAVTGFVDSFSDIPSDSNVTWRGISSSIVSRGYTLSHNLLPDGFIRAVQFSYVPVNNATIVILDGNTEIATFAGNVATINCDLKRTGLNIGIRFTSNQAYRTDSAAGVSYEYYTYDGNGNWNLITNASQQKFWTCTFDVDFNIHSAENIFNDSSKKPISSQVVSTFANAINESSKPSSIWDFTGTSGTISTSNTGVGIYKDDLPDGFIRKITINSLPVGTELIVHVLEGTVTNSGVLKSKWQTTTTNPIYLNMDLKKNGYSLGVQTTDGAQLQIANMPKTGGYYLHLDNTGWSLTNNPNTVRFFDAKFEIGYDFNDESPNYIGFTESVIRKNELSETTNSIITKIPSDVSLIEFDAQPTDVISIGTLASGSFTTEKIITNTGHIRLTMGEYEYIRISNANPFSVYDNSILPSYTLSGSTYVENMDIGFLFKLYYTKETTNLTKLYTHSAAPLKLVPNNTILEDGLINWTFSPNAVSSPKKATYKSIYTSTTTQNVEIVTKTNSYNVEFIKRAIQGGINKSNNMVLAPYMTDNKFGTALKTVYDQYMQRLSPQYFIGNIALKENNVPEKFGYVNTAGYVPKDFITGALDYSNSLFVRGVSNDFSNIPNGTPFTLNYTLGDTTITRDGWFQPVEEESPDFRRIYMPVGIPASSSSDLQNISSMTVLGTTIIGINAQPGFKSPFSYMPSVSQINVSKFYTLNGGTGELNRLFVYFDWTLCDNYNKWRHDLEYLYSLFKTAYAGIQIFEISMLPIYNSVDTSNITLLGLKEIFRRVNNLSGDDYTVLPLFYTIDETDLIKNSDNIYNMTELSSTGAKFIADLISNEINRNN